MEAGAGHGVRQGHGARSCDGMSCMLVVVAAVSMAAGVLITVASVCKGRYMSTAEKWQFSLLGLLLLCSGCMAMLKGTLRIFFSNNRQPGLAAVLTTAENRVPRNPSSITLPPSYDALNISNSQSLHSFPEETPPPNYEEAVYLMADEKLRAFIDADRKTGNEAEKSTVPK